MKLTGAAKGDSWTAFFLLLKSLVGRLLAVTTDNSLKYKQLKRITYVNDAQQFQSSLKQSTT